VLQDLSVPCGSAFNAVVKRSVVSVFINRRFAESVGLYYELCV